MAVSARQLERQRDPDGSPSGSLVLYQQAIQLLVPCLGTRTTAVIASCVVLCVLEMLSCSPRDWRRHLSGCATLLETVQINGFSGGLEGALFWCFVRMDVCGGLISSKETLIPVCSWTAAPDLQTAVRLFESNSFHYESHANYAVFLTAHAIKLLSSRQMVTAHGSLFGPSDTSGADEFAVKWLELWGLLDEWHSCRPMEMYPAFTRNASPFPTILFTTPSAISGMRDPALTKPSIRQH